MGAPHEQHSSRPAAVPVVLRAAESSSKRYITVLPPTLDALLLKARSLFPVPPGNTPYITLDQDEQTVILEDALPFLREREVLVFRWSPDTPRKSHGKSVKWDSSVADAQKSAGSSTPSSSSSRSNRAGAPTSTADAQAAGPSSIAGGSTRSASTSSTTSSPQTQLTQAQQHRAAHARRVLEEQRRIQEEEQAEAARQKAEEEEERRLAEEVGAEERRKAEQARKDEEERAAEEAKRKEEEALAQRARLAEQQEQERLAAEQQVKEMEQSSDQQTGEAHSFGAATPSRQQEQSLDTRVLSPTDLEASGSSPPPYSSPRKPALEREVTPTIQDDNDEDHIQSSPLVASPTREVHAAVAKASMSPHGDKLVAGRSPVSVRCIEDEGAEQETTVHDIVMQDSVREEQAQCGVEPISLTTETSVAADMATGTPADEPAVAVDAPMDSTVAQGKAEELTNKSLPASPVQDAARAQVVEQTDAVYKTMRSVVDNLRNHPGNTAFRDPMPLDYASFAESSPDGRGPIDLYIILSRITKREYGASDASPGPLEAFTSDLKRMWSLARSFYGPKSPQGQCAALLERFAEVVIAEWKLRPAHAIKSTPTHDAAGRGVANVSGGKNSKSGKHGGAADDKEAARRKAAALMASWNSSIGAAAMGASPTSRGEKRGINGGDEDVFNSRLAGGRALPFQRRPAKQQRTNSSSGEKAVDMMAFHRAIMGEKAPLPGNVATAVPVAVPVEVVVPRSERQQIAPVEEEAEKENTSPIPSPIAPASKEMIVEEQARDEEQEVAPIVVADDTVESHHRFISTTKEAQPYSIFRHHRIAASTRRGQVNGDGQGEQEDSKGGSNGGTGGARSGCTARCCRWAL
ncbi:hypothetical protein BCV69DRAFT_13588 [Microstroma glucosiphilum]|uniref:Bromo domain-containing protein n=1 Tax=Pseudomicrostroma glucosiphilum TaxID=1684307 RepID=A0A316UFC2_9BASI|nr:hypothetical protein BCV69DRAFT_13588 [Pseudomicrostroma glucosiphilum]PWN23910.1 hypothetical protein BCV69DRAFT_13588 [Pseudomicrostroma glucosiphilum]